MVIIRSHSVKGRRAFAFSSSTTPQTDMLHSSSAPGSTPPHRAEPDTDAVTEHSNPLAFFADILSSHSSYPLQASSPRPITPGLSLPSIHSLKDLEENKNQKLLNQSCGSKSGDGAQGNRYGPEGIQFSPARGLCDNEFQPYHSQELQNEYQPSQVLNDTAHQRSRENEYQISQNNYRPAPLDKYQPGGIGYHSQIIGYQADVQSKIQELREGVKYKFMSENESLRCMPEIDGSNTTSSLSNDVRVESTTSNLPTIIGSSWMGPTGVGRNANAYHRHSDSQVIARVPPERDEECRHVKSKIFHGATDVGCTPRFGTQHRVDSGHSESFDDGNIKSEFDGYDLNQGRLRDEKASSNNNAKEYPSNNATLSRGEAENQDMKALNNDQASSWKDASAARNSRYVKVEDKDTPAAIQFYETQLIRELYPSNQHILTHIEPEVDERKLHSRSYIGFHPNYTTPLDFYRPRPATNERSITSNQTLADPLFDQSHTLHERTLALNLMSLTTSHISNTSALSPTSPTHRTKRLNVCTFCTKTFTRSYGTIFFYSRYEAAYGCSS